MSFVLVRVDDRLIHGQVVVAWGSALSPEHIVLANDEVAECDWRCDLYADSDAMGVRISIMTLSEFSGALGDGAFEDERTFVLVESPADLLELIRGGLDIPEANIGGIHYAEGKSELLPYVFVDDADVAAMKEIMASGTRLSAADVPQAQPQDLAVLLRALEEK
jgi:mannose/fructose/N-acetylgalactosamine-specific phosphotransferase system component IIB